MPRSYEKINYSLRPAKSIERKMLGEALRRLSDFDLVESYRYIGFGSTFFSDFVLFHKALGFRNMISIEHDAINEYRFRFNCPYNCIQIEWGESNDILPQLPWDIRTILWLDYDEPLSDNVLRDIAWFCTYAMSGSVIVVTVNAEPNKIDPRKLDKTQDYFEQTDKYRLDLLVNQVGMDRVPAGIEGKNLASWKKANVYRTIIGNEIVQALDTRNGGRTAGTEMQFKQLFNFHYADGAKMLTVGGLLYDQGQSSIADKCAFENLPFVRTGEESYEIVVPNLTYRELRHLDTMLPVVDEGVLQTPLPIPQEQLQMYARVYRYFPTFAEAEL